LLVNTKTPQALYTFISQEHSFHIGLGNLPLRKTFPITWPYSLCGSNDATVGIRMLLFQHSVFLTSSKHRNAHSGWQECETDHRNSLNVDKEINHFHMRNMWSDIISTNVLGRKT
jgi:hypothetical protein